VPLALHSPTYTPYACCRVPSTCMCCIGVAVPCAVLVTIHCLHLANTTMAKKAHSGVHMLACDIIFFVIVTAVVVYVAFVLMA
jgi:hypothetical protein